MNEKITAILHTAGKSDKELLAEGGLVSELDLPWLRAVANAWEGAEVYLRESRQGVFSLVGWDESDPEIDARVKEAIWQMEQDPVFGNYCDDRESFEEDWRAGECEVAASITFAAKDVQILNETPQEKFTRLIANHPGLEIIPMVADEVTGDDYRRQWTGCIGNSYVTEYVPAKDVSEGRMTIWQRNDTAILINIAMDAYPEETYETARKKAMEKVEAMPWKKAIIVNIDLPEVKQ